mmetsp:Transcript_4297/g.9285  ORF Transcript_4297/g.9285 Transcript_4297/m.9285 type:complete len:223 (-) Transcript_4297:164-832(-)
MCHHALHDVDLALLLLEGGRTQLAQHEQCHLPGRQALLAYHLRRWQAYNWKSLQNALPLPHKVHCVPHHPSSQGFSVQHDDRGAWQEGTQWLITLNCSLHQFSILSDPLWSTEQGKTILLQSLLPFKEGLITQSLEPRRGWFTHSPNLVAFLNLHILDREDEGFHTMQLPQALTHTESAGWLGLPLRQPHEMDALVAAPHGLVHSQHHSLNLALAGLALGAI